MPRDTSNLDNSGAWARDVLVRLNALLVEVETVADASWNDYVRTGRDSAYAMTTRKLTEALTRSAAAATRVVMSTRRL